MSYDVPMERGKIREFAAATKSTNPAYDRSGAVIPPTFLTTARNFWETSDESAFDELGFDNRRVLHGEEEFVFHGPPPTAGQMLTASSRLGERYEREGKRGGTMRFAKVMTEYRDDNGTLVAEQHTTVVETGKPPTSDGSSKGDQS